MAERCTDCGEEFTGGNSAVAYGERLVCTRDYERIMQRGPAPPPPARPRATRTRGQSTAELLTVIGWLSLATGIIGCIWIWIAFGTVLVPITPAGVFDSVDYVERTSPVAVGIAVGLFIQGLVSFAICTGLSGVLKNQAVRP